MTEPTPEADLAALEAALAQLRPAPTEISSARVLYRAGQEAARRPSWAWPCATAVLALTTLTLGTVLLVRPRPAVERVVYVRVEPPAPASLPPASDRQPPPPAAIPPVTQESDSGLPEGNYLKLREQVVRWGPDALPRLPVPSLVPKPATPDSLLGLPPDAFQGPLSLRLKNALHSGDAL